MRGFPLWFHFCFGEGDFQNRPVASLLEKARRYGWLKEGRLELASPLLGTVSGDNRRAGVGLAVSCCGFISVLGKVISKIVP